MVTLQTIRNVLTLKAQSQRDVRIKTSVPQDSVLGPGFFIIDMNVISVASETFKLIIYADDSTLTSILQASNHTGWTHHYKLEGINLM